MSETTEIEKNPMDEIRNGHMYKHQKVLLVRVSQPAYRCVSLEKTAEFFRDVLGFNVEKLTAELLEYPDGWRESPHLVLQRDGCRLTFLPHQGNIADHLTYIQIEVQNIGAYFDAVVPKLPAEQAKKKLKHWGDCTSSATYFTVTDPSGHYVRFIANNGFPV